MTTAAESRLDGFVAAVIDRVVEKLGKLGENDASGVVREVLVDFNPEDEKAVKSRSDVLSEVTAVATERNFSPVTRCAAVKKTAFYKALCDYFETFLTEDGSDVTADEEMLGAMRVGIQDVERSKAASWLVENKNEFEPALGIAFAKIRRRARAEIARTIVEVYSPPPAREKSAFELLLDKYENV